MNDYSEFRCPYRSKKEIGIVASDFRDIYWKDKPLPIDMEKIITKDLGLDIIPEPNIVELTSTDAYLQSDCTAIIVDLKQYMDDSDRYAGRLRFAMAHEVGHFILHRSAYETLEIDSVDQYIEYIENMPEGLYSSFEWQANEFAGSLLVPRELLQTEIRKLVDEIIEQGIAHLLPQYSYDILARNLGKLALPFGVSTTAIGRRVKEENFWPPAEDTL